MSTLSGPYASSLGQTATVAPAWAKWTNANGGLDGHPVQVVLEDDQNSPAVGQSVAQTLMSDHVAAIVQPGDNTITAYDSAVTAMGIPMIGGTSVQPDWYTKVGMFPTATDVASQVGNAYTAIAQKFVHAKKFATTYCAEIAACAETVPVLRAAAQKAGMGFTSLSVSATAPSYTAPCLQLQQEGADLLDLGAAAATNAKFVKDCKAQGYNPTYEMSDESYSSSYLGLGATMYGVAVQFPLAYTGQPVASFTSAMERYATNSNWKDGNASQTWAGLQVAAKAIQDANVPANTPVTAADALNGLYSFKGENLDGLLANKLTFTRGQPAGPNNSPCWFVIGVKGGKLTAPDGLTPQCPGA